MEGSHDLHQKPPLHPASPDLPRVGRSSFMDGFCADLSKYLWLIRISDGMELADGWSITCRSFSSCRNCFSFFGIYRDDLSPDREQEKGLASSTNNNFFRPSHPNRWLFSLFLIPLLSGGRYAERGWMYSVPAYRRYGLAG